jgi:ribosome-associated protein
MMDRSDPPGTTPRSGASAATHGSLVTGRGLRVPAAALRWQFSRSGGPGGQHVNTADTRAELVCDVTLLRGPEATVARVRERLGDEVRVVASDSRSQLQNRRTARERLGRQLDAAAAIARTRRPTRPTRGATEARLRAKRLRSQRKVTRRAPDDD